MKPISVTTENAITHVTLTRGEKMNAMSLEMRDALIEAAHGLRNSDTRAVILSGEGNGFCAGIDLMSLAALQGQDMDALLLTRSHGARNAFQEVSLVWRDLPVPVIAALHGVCFGAGLQLALGTDIRIAAPDTRLSIMEMKWGLVPDMGGMTLLPQLLRSDHLRRLIYTAEELSANDALEMGLVTELADDPQARAAELAAQIANQSPGAIRAAKRLIATAETASEPEVLMAESGEQASLVGTPDQMAAIAKGLSAKPSR